MDTREEDDLYLHAGGLLMFSSGEYSDYGTMGCFVALEDLSRSRLREIAGQTLKDQAVAEAAHEEAVAIWRAEGSRGQDYPHSPEDPGNMFVAALIRAGLLLSVTYTELHIGSYGCLELGF